MLVIKRDYFVTHNGGIECNLIDEVDKDAGHVTNAQQCHFRRSSKRTNAVGKTETSDYIHISYRYTCWLRLKLELLVRCRSKPMIVVVQQNPRLLDFLAYSSRSSARHGSSNKRHLLQLQEPKTLPNQVVQLEICMYQEGRDQQNASVSNTGKEHKTKGCSGCHEGTKQRRRLYSSNKL